MKTFTDELRSNHPNKTVNPLEHLVGSNNIAAIIPLDG